MEGEKYTPNPGEVMKKRAETRAEVKAGMIEKHIAKKEALAADLQRKQEFAAAQAASDAEKMRQAEQSILEAAFFDDGNPLDKVGKQEGRRFGKQTVTIIGPSTESYSSGLPGMDAKTLGRAAAESRKREEAGENLDVQDVVVEKPSAWSKIKNFFKRGGQQRDSLSKQPTLEKKSEEEPQETEQEEYQEAA